MTIYVHNHLGNGKGKHWIFADGRRVAEGKSMKLLNLKALHLMTAFAFGFACWAAWYSLGFVHAWYTDMVSGAVLPMLTFYLLNAKAMLLLLPVPVVIYSLWVVSTQGVTLEKTVGFLAAVLLFVLLLDSMLVVSFFLPLQNVKWVHWMA